jgi:hypothetical protein
VSTIPQVYNVPQCKDCETPMAETFHSVPLRVLTLGRKWGRS